MSESAASSNSGKPAYTNRLVGEKSPYLLQHAHNPVDWYPWGEEAFAAARALNRPIFLSVGYSACHWCHVMERESFEDPNLADLLNREFVSIKVDREERPDVDEVYMTAVQMTTGSGGWPMSVFLLPDGRPFYGGTYFPPESRQGRIGFPSLLTQLADAYRNRRGEVDSVGASIAEDLQKMARQRPPATGGEQVAAESLLTLAVEDMATRFDAANGGFGGAPKFPPHHALRLLTLSARNGNGDAPRFLIATLDKMALGGIYDHVGGGFHRYATDAVWLLPHFEKMLYDNALLARVYTEAFDLTGNAAYARVAREICDWVIRDLADEAGGFYAALDADSEGEEGRYYAWTNADARSAIADDAAANDFVRDYHILVAGNYRDEATGRATGANIPYLAVGPSNTVLPDSLSPSLSAARSALLESRYRRVAPATDDKVITAWNGLMIGALAVCGSRLDRPEYISAARRAADFCLTVLRTETGDLMRRYAKGSAGLPGFLDDYAFLGDGLLDLFDATGDERYAAEARSLADVLLDRFWDAEDGGFFYSGSGQETLIARTKDMFDGALPSSNGVATRLLVRLGRLSGGEVYRSSAQSVMSNFNSVLARAPQGTPTLIEAAVLFGEGEESSATLMPTGPVSLSVAGPQSVTASRGESVVLTFVLTIAADFHVNARYLNNADLVPTVATLVTDLPASVGPIVYPAATVWTSGEESLSTFQGDAQFLVPIAIPADAHIDNYRLTLEIRCQPCSNAACHAPQTLSSSVTFEITA